MSKTFVMPATRLLKKQINSSDSKENNIAGRKGISMPAVPVLQNKLPVQKVEEKEPLQGKFTAQLKSKEEEELPVQAKFTIQKKENKTGLPDNLKEEVENLSGMAMDDVRVKYNSDKPARLNAFAYAQGTDIHIGPGQEKHLPHEAWHVVQQKQGRVKSTMQMKESVAVNDDKDLENEADVMGAKALIKTGFSKTNIPLQATGQIEKEKPIQTKSFSTAAGKNRLGLTGTVATSADESEIKLKGNLKDTDDKDVAVTGSVYMPEYKTSTDRSTDPVAAVTRSMFQNYWDPADALRVQNLNAEPRGMKLGQVLTYQHSLEAIRKNKPYVIAMKVSDARSPFYEPLGFSDYNGSRPWKELKKMHDDILTFLRSDESSTLSQEEIGRMIQKKDKLVEEMSNSSMIISSVDLKNNSINQLQTVWAE